MKILITGAPASGKTIYARFLSDTRYNYPVYDFDNFTNFYSFTDSFKDLVDCIVILQHQKFLNEAIKFDLHFECTRFIDDDFDHKILVKSTAGIEEFYTQDLQKYFL